MFNYLYYKLYQAALHSSLKSIPGVAAASWFGCLLGVKIIILNAFLAKINIGHFLVTDATFGGLLVAVLIAVVMLQYRKKNFELILKNYSKVSNN